MTLPKAPLDAPPPSAREAKLIEVKADRVDLPPSVAGNAFDHLLYGPMAGQPSKATTSDGARRSSLLFWVLLALVVFCLYFFRSPDRGTPNALPPPQPRPAAP